MNYLSLNIKYLQELSGLGKDEFGREFGLNRGAIGSYIINGITPKLDFLQKISVKYHVTIDELLNENLAESEKKSQLEDINSMQIHKLKDKINELQGEIITLQREKIQYKDQINELEKELEKGKNIVALSSVKIA